MRNILIITFIMTLSFGLIVAQNVNEKTASIVAKNFYYENVNQFNEKFFSDINIMETYIKKDEFGTTVLYIFNIENGGFIAISSHNSAEPIPFYSFKGKYNDNYTNPAFDFWIKQYVSQISYAIKSKLTPNIKTEQKWSHLILSEEKDLIISKEKAIPPLLVSEWNQGSFYNEECPADAGGPGGYVYAGCVATAMGQVLYYHRFPATGSGTYSYYHNEYGTISADYENTTYEWNGMLNSLDDSNYPVALLLHHLGVGVDMDYGPNGSGMWNHSAAYVMRTYFKYCPETQYLFKDSTSLDWDSVLIANLDNKKPMYYAGWADDSSFTSGHAFVCDGYQTPGYYHFNWGWGGAYDGFFYTSDLTPGGSQFTYAQEVIKDIYPDTLNYTYPEGCSVSDTITYVRGTLNDGSNIKDYENNINCEYLIAPACGKKLELVFDKFEFGTGDTLFVYDGTSATGQLLNVFSQVNQPELSSSTTPTTIISENGELFLSFISNNMDVANGWDLSYFSRFCEAETTLTDSAGVVTDGSDDCNYLNSENCKWYIEPTGADSIYLNFTKFDLAPNAYDYILIHKEYISASTLIGKFDYSNIPTYMTIPSGVCIITFKTSSSETDDGWELEYFMNPVDINKPNLNKFNLLIYPNPFVDNTKITYLLSGNTLVKFEVTNIFGELIGSLSLQSDDGYNEIYLNSIVNNINSGIYFINIKTENHQTTRKILCIN